MATRPPDTEQPLERPAASRYEKACFDMLNACICTLFFAFTVVGVAAAVVLTVDIVQAGHVQRLKGCAA